MSHVNWDRDLRLPNHELKPGDQYFRNLKYAETVAFVKEQSKDWEETGAELDDKISRVACDLFSDGTQPHIVEFKEGDKQIRSLMLDYFPSGRHG